jgi:hypothetical protein
MVFKASGDEIPPLVIKTSSSGVQYYTPLNGFGWVMPT